MSSSVPQWYSDYVPPIDYSELLATIIASENDAAAATVTSSNTALTSSTSGAMWGEENYVYPMFDNGAHNVVSPESDIGSISSVPMLNFSEGIGMADITSMLEIPEYNNTSCLQLQGLVDQTKCDGYHQDAWKFAEGGCKFVPENVASGENWRTVHNVPTTEESNIKVGRYSPEERKDRIMRYLEKRNRRNFNKTIKYACRKTLADRRVRVRGRFARNNELCEDHMPMKKNTSPSNKIDPFFGNADQTRIVDEEECWLQDMMGSLLYLPYMTG